MPTVTLYQVLTCPTLPSLPTVTVQVLQAASNPNVELDDIAAIIQNDPALSARVLKTVNSSFYALPRACPTVQRAMTYMGLNTVKSLVLGFSLVDFTKMTEHGLDPAAYWRRCAYASAAARLIARHSGTCDPDEAFTAALMQDLGMLAMHCAIGAQYLEVLARVLPYGRHAALAQTEREVLGFDHAYVGACLGERWHLPEQFVNAIRHHHDSDGSCHSPMVRAVMLGCRASGMILDPDPAAALPEFNRCALEWFGFDAPKTAQLLGEIQADTRELASLLQVNTGEEPDINSLLAQAQEASLLHQLSMHQQSEQLQRSNVDLSHQAFTDPLTGVGNRRRFDETLEEQFQSARSSGECLGVIVADADKFKSLNDAHGHQVGDAVLVELARRMSEHVKNAAGEGGQGAGQEDGLVCRYGGEEFAVILPGADRKAAARLAEGMRAAIAASPFDVSHVKGAEAGNQTVPVRVSMGVAVLEPAVSDRIRSPHLLVQAADKALYAAKQGGRNCVRVFTLKPVAHV